MTRSALLALASAAALLLAAAPAPAATPRCSAGHTLYAKGGARVFYVDREEAVFGCHRRDARARRLVYDDPTYGSFRLLRRVGTILPFLEVTSGEGGGYFNQLGWFDLRTGRAALMRPFQYETDLRVLDLAVARDGTTAVVSREDEQVAVVSIHRRIRRGRPGEGRGLAFVSGRYVARSLRLRGRTVSWQDAGGARSVPVTGEPLSCTAGRTKLAVGAVRVFEALDPATNRGNLHWCGPAAPEPRALPRAPRFRPPLRDALTLSPEVAGRVAFSGEGIAGVAAADPGTVRTVARVMEFDAVAPGPRGELVAAFDKPNGEIEGGILVAPPSTTDPFALEKPHLVATYRERIEDGSLTVEGETISWKTDRGARSVPITGETVVSCQAGATLDERDGVRVFELLDVAHGTRTMYACRPDAGGPLSLLTQEIGRPFPQWFVGLRNGRGALVRWGDRERDPDTVVTFGTTQESLRRGTIPRDDRHIGALDLDVGTDDAVAFILDLQGGELEVHYMAPTPSGLADARRVARRKGGYQRRSLTVTDTEISWRNRAGRTLRVARP